MVGSRWPHGDFMPRAPLFNRSASPNPEWQPTMPFTTQQFFEVFRRYNEAVWPAQAVLLGLGLAAAYLAWRPLAWSDRFITVALAVLWAWMGVVYHLIFFLPINPAASLFGGLFILEAILILGAGLQGRLRFRASRDARGVDRGHSAPVWVPAVPLGRQELWTRLSREFDVRAAMPDDHCDAGFDVVGLPARPRYRAGDPNRLVGGRHHGGISAGNAGGHRPWSRRRGGADRCPAGRSATAGRDSRVALSSTARRLVLRRFQPFSAPGAACSHIRPSATLDP